jgi:hypothetical protein
MCGAWGLRKRCQGGIRKFYHLHKDGVSPPVSASKVKYHDRRFQSQTVHHCRFEYYTDYYYISNITQPINNCLHDVFASYIPSLAGYVPNLCLHTKPCRTTNVAYSHGRRRSRLYRSPNNLNNTIYPRLITITQRLQHRARGVISQQTSGSTPR